MASTKLSNAVSKFEEDLGSVEKVLKTPLAEAVTFVKKHKKMIAIVAVGYFVYRYLFSEEE